MRYIAVLLLAALAASACHPDTPSNNKKPKAAHRVEVVQVQYGPLAVNRTLAGSLESAQTVDIYNQEQGKLIALPHFPGDAVKRGEVLARLDDTLIRAEVDKAEAAFQQAKLDLKRLERLAPRQLASEDELARAKTAVQQARAELDLLQARLDHTVITAPMDGIISQRLKEPGDVLPVYSHLLTLFDPSALQVKLNVSEIMLANVQLKMPVTIRIDALGDARYTGVISRIYPTVDPATRQGIIEIRLEPRPEQARPGQLCRVIIESQTAPMKTLPLQAVRRDARGEYVFRIVEQAGNVVARYVSVKTGLQLGQRIQIVEGVEAGDRIVSKGFLELRDGKQVVIQSTASQTLPAAAPKPTAQDQHS